MFSKTTLAKCRRQCTRCLRVPGFLSPALWLTLVFACPALGVKYEVGGIVIKSRRNAVQLSTPQCPHGTNEAGEHPHIRYSFKSPGSVYELKYDKSSGNIGIRKPTYYNWYRGGAFSLRVNGEKFAPTPDRLIDEKITGGDTGLAKFTWRADFGKVTYRFTLPAYSRGLHLGINIEPKRRVESLELRLKNSPGGFSGEKAIRRGRLMQTGRGTYHAGRGADTVEFNPRQNNWLLFMNDKLNFGDEEQALGPSAVAFDPAGVRRGQLNFGFFMSTRLVFEPGTRQIHLVFWELPEMTNQEALEWFKSRLDHPDKTLFSSQNAGQ